MVNDLLTAVTTQLGTTFGTSNHYYTETVQQDLVTPAFTVGMILPTQRSKSPVLYDRTMPIVIHWFSDTQDDLKEKCYKIAEQAVECLEYLPFKGKIIRAENISWEIVDNVLQIFMTYKFTTMKVLEDDVNMEVLDENKSLIN